ncbi:hypothetical protein Val02_49490 [Virgisporangium aliadipatigenens]|uniref:DUF2993 domain-containing protein n=1 Tax=Virgisporangium aliadipatigenens TaxID=741659 RepID=A0A8J3YPR2_9ACTN|nr:DUF2993 domain-containing protein [Virgisporangium aliadipatigenens]GIJ48063.1 hypothetical protein Val02_49490 [Virgisporangium aliadipatigenens]
MSYRIRPRLPRSRRARISAAAFLIVIIAATVADRVAATVASRRLATRLACAAGLARTPAIDLHGFPFLTQVAAGSYPHLTVTATDVVRGELRVRRVDADLRDVAVGDGRFTVAELRVDLVVGFDGLPTRLGDRPVSYVARGDRLGIRTEARFAGQSVPVTILAVPRLEGATLAVTPDTVEVFGVQRSAGQVLARMGVDRTPTRTLPDLPEKVAYRSVGVVDDGLRITVGGHDLSGPATGAGTRNGDCGGAR